MAREGVGMGCSFCGASAISKTIQDTDDGAFLNVSLKHGDLDIAAFVNSALALNVLMPINYCPECGRELDDAVFPSADLTIDGPNTAFLDVRVKNPGSLNVSIYDDQKFKMNAVLTFKEFDE